MTLMMMTLMMMMMDDERKDAKEGRADWIGLNDRLNQLRMDEIGVPDGSDTDVTLVVFVIEKYRMFHQSVS